ncbi:MULTISPECIES: tryptorubin family RiPP precursor [Streptomyces]
MARGFPRPPTRKEGKKMRLLFSLKNKMSQQKSLKAHAWYIWY